MDHSKGQTESVPTPEGLPPDVIVSPDTRREGRLPPGQRRTLKWPVLDASGPPSLSLDRWRLGLGGMVAQSSEWNWEQFLQLPRVKVFSDFHCVTRWSRLGNLWEGVSTRELVRQAGGAQQGAAYVVVHGYDGGFTTNLSLPDFLAGDALIAFHHDGEAITEAHGGPARLIVPRLYAWKSAKWVAAIEIVDRDQAGFWEQNGYHMRGDPWLQERYSRTRPTV
jgi:DMSO/TMAO reductase YedYZ molybdopterin-dependent catalytic subunit